MTDSANRAGPADSPIRWAVAGILLITAYRVILLWFSEAELFVDEAQYWFWGQTLEGGYYSKPPLIAWVMRAVTDLAGSHSQFWVRLPAPLLHAATALILLSMSRSFHGPRTAALVGLAYITIPAVAVGSHLFTTDTLMFPFLALALWLYLGLCREPSVGKAALAGVLLGLAMLSKYAAAYFFPCAILAAIFVPTARPSWRDVAVVLVLFVVTMAPNILWNLQNDLATLDHTVLDNIGLDNEKAVPLNIAGLLEFVGAQFGVFGPVLFMAYLLTVPAALRHGTPLARTLVWFSMPILLIVCGQALTSRAYANWAVAAYIAATLLVIPAILARAAWTLWLSFAINGAAALALPILATQATTLRIAPGEPLLLERYVGRRALTEESFAKAAEVGATSIVADHRDPLADMFYRLDDQPFDIYAVPPDGRVRHHYQQKHPVPQGAEGPMLLVFAGPTPEGCAVEEIGRHEATEGAYRRLNFRYYLAEENCWP